MQCANCGSTLNPHSRFCDQCGAVANDVEETRIARQQSSTPARYDDDDIESVIFTVRPTMLFIKIGYAAAVIGAILLTILLAMIKFIDIPWFVSVPIALNAQTPSPSQPPAKGASNKLVTLVGCVSTLVISAVSLSFTRICGTDSTRALALV